MAPRRHALVLALGLAAIAGLAGCGAEPDEETAIIVSQTSQPDRLDPALSNELGGQESLWLVYTPLLTYRHAEGEEGTELIPGLASDFPEISEDGLTYRLNLREGLEYSDGTPVVASDFEHTVKRVLALDSAGSPFFEGIVGARSYAAAGRPEADIPGIRTEDETGEIVIRLTSPDATFANVLAMSFAGLVPPRTPFRDMSAAPPPGVGPYVITSSTPGSEFVLERSDVFPELDIPDIPIGSIDRITTRIVPSERRQAQDVLDNKLDYMHGAPPAGMLQVIEEQAADRFEEHATISTYYFFFDVDRPPFDDPLVREAVNRGLDRAALARIYGGALAPGCAFLAPAIPGYDEEFDTSECPYGDPTRDPDLSAARALIRQADAEGANVTVSSSRSRQTRRATLAYARMLNAIGLDARKRSRAAPTGLMSLAPDLPHPLDFFAGVDGDPSIDAEIERLSVEPELDAAEWAELDRYVVSPPQSYVAPLGHAKRATFFSERMDLGSAIFHPVYGNDYSSWTLKEGE